MSLESDIFTKLSTISAFVSVNYLVKDAGDDELPTDLPFAVFQLGPKDFSELQTFCGTNTDFYLQNFEVSIFAMTTVEASDLANQCIAALTGTGVLTSVTTAFEPELRCYVTVVTFS